MADIHIKCTEAEKSELKLRAKKTRRSITGYILYKCLDEIEQQMFNKCTTNVQSKEIITKDDDINFKRTITPIPKNTHKPSALSADDKNIVKNMFANKTKKKILKKVI